MKKLVSILILALALTLTNLLVDCNCDVAFCQQQIQPAGQGPTGMTAAVVAIAATSTKVTLTAPSNYLVIVNPSSSATVYWSPVSPATTTSFPVEPESFYAYSGVPLSAFWAITSTGSVNVGVCAH